MSDEAGTYKLMGSNRPGEKVDRIVLEGPSSDPTRYIDLGEKGNLTAEEVTQLRRQGYKITKQADGESESSDAPDVETETTKPEQTEQQPSGQSRRRS